MSKDFDNKVVVITGATAGAGRATARAFAQAGANLGLLARGQEGLGSTSRAPATKRSGTQRRWS